jgi:hypothetical protein
VTLVVSRGTLLIDGKPACPKCGLRPRIWSGYRYQAYCQPCRREYRKAYMRERRAGKIEMLLSPEEVQAVRAIRAAAAAGLAPLGRHRR